MNKLLNLIHVGKLLQSDGWIQYFFLRKLTPHKFQWFEIASDGTEKETIVMAPSIEEAIRLAYRQWQLSLLPCGYRYTLPERDEHGVNALFYQMVASYSSINGVYFDETLGNNCFVQNAPTEARMLWKTWVDQSNGK